MTVEKVETLVIGGGQAGLAMSAHLGAAGLDHLVLERGRIAERWRSERWDSLVANGPAWHDRFPDLEFAGVHPDAFPGKDRVVDYFVEYAEKISSPIRCGVQVTNLKRKAGSLGFEVDTTAGGLEARNVVVATGPFQRPVIPAVIPDDAGVYQVHSSGYRNPDQLPDGAVLVVGSGASGVQIAEEILRSGRNVYLSVGPHHRPPRAYRGRDYCWWLGVLGKWDAAAPTPGTAHIAISVSGAHGGHTVDFRRLAADGVTLMGLTESYSDGELIFANDLADTIAEGDANYLSVLDEADAYIAENGLDLPEEPDARIFEPDPDCLTQPMTELSLKEAGIGAVVWATGYAVDYDWLKVDIFDDAGRPRHQRGVTAVQGLYFLGLPWLSRRGSSFIWGVWHDARHLADQIGIQRNYLAYEGTGAPAR